VGTTEMGTLCNGKTFYFVKNAVSDSGKVQSFDIEGKDIIEGIIINPHRHKP
jgi:hypothetical protein